MVRLFSIKEAARETKIPETTLRRACEEGLIRATHFSGGWRIAEDALDEALSKGMELKGLSKKSGGKKQEQPKGLKRYQDEQKKQKAA